MKEFERALDEWAEDDSPTEEQFHNKFFNLFFSLQAPDFQVARIFIHWIETVFYDYIARFAECDLRDTLEVAHLSFLSDIHSWNLRTRMKQLRKRLGASSTWRT